MRNILVIAPKVKNCRYFEGRLELLTATSFDLAGSACRFDLAEIEKLLD